MDSIIIILMYCNVPYFVIIYSIGGTYPSYTFMFLLNDQFLNKFQEFNLWNVKVYKYRRFLLFFDFFFTKELHQFSEPPTKATCLCMHVCVCAHMTKLHPFISLLENKDLQYLPDFLYIKAPQSISQDYCSIQSSTSEKII